MPQSSPHHSRRSRFDQIPYAAALVVETTWLFSGTDELRVRCYYRCVFDLEVLSIPSWIRSYCVHQARSRVENFSAAPILLKAGRGKGWLRIVVLDARRRISKAEAAS